MALRKRTRKALRLLKSRKYRRALCHGAAGAIEHKTALRDLSCKTVVDIGANKGQFSLVAVDAFPDACVYAFEPLVGPADVYRRVFVDDDRVSLTQAAIGPKFGTGKMYVSRREDSSSLLEITSLQESMFPGTGLKETTEIEVGPLDHYVRSERIQAPALLKLDVQGYELQALKGCTNLLRLFNNIYVECSFVELYLGQALAYQVIEYLLQHDFHLCGLYNMVSDANDQAIQADHMFQRQT